MSGLLLFRSNSGPRFSVPFWTLKSICIVTALKLFILLINRTVIQKFYVHATTFDKKAQVFTFFMFVVVQKCLRIDGTNIYCYMHLKDIPVAHTRVQRCLTVLQNLAQSQKKCKKLRSDFRTLLLTSNYKRQQEMAGLGPKVRKHLETHGLTFVNFVHFVVCFRVKTTVLQRFLKNNYLRQVHYHKYD